MKDCHFPLIFISACVYEESTTNTLTFRHLFNQFGEDRNMKGLGIYLMLGGVAIALSLSIQASYAADASNTTAQSPKFDESAPRQERGFGFTSIMPAVKPNIQAPSALVKPAVTPAVIKASTKAVHSTQSKTKKAEVVAKAKNNSPVTAKLPITKSTINQPTNTQVMNVSHSVILPSGSVVTASLDHPGKTPSYKVGDKLTVNVSAKADCNVVVFNYDSTGTLTQIFPNDYQQSGFLKAGESMQIGGADSAFDYQIAGKGGTEKIFVYAYPTGTEQPIEIALSQVPGTPFRSTEMSLEKYRELVNGSKSFFSREVKVIPKKGAQLASNSASSPPPNKVELTFIVEK